MEGPCTVEDILQSIHSHPKMTAFRRITITLQVAGTRTYLKESTINLQGDVQAVGEDFQLLNVSWMEQLEMKPITILDTPFLTASSHSTHDLDL